jgi:nucleoside-triphosphatase THEP1
MLEFAGWRSSARGSNEHVLWIRGGPGVGKSTLSAYIATILKQEYPDAIISYFFCKSGQQGLMRAADIICRLAYQCSEHDTAAKSELEYLKRQNFPVGGNIGVRYMSEELLKGPLEGVAKEIYVVFDGLDELDSQEDAKNLVWKLADICTSSSMRRVMIASRPQADIQSVVASSIVRTIDSKDNTNDIWEHIASKLEEVPTLRRRFEEAQIDARQYFEKHANGMFL